MNNRILQTPPATQPTSGSTPDRSNRRDGVGSQRRNKSFDQAMDRANRADDNQRAAADQIASRQAAAKSAATKAQQAADTRRRSRPTGDEGTTVKQPDQIRQPTNGTSEESVTTRSENEAESATAEASAKAEPGLSPSVESRAENPIMQAIIAGEPGEETQDAEMDPAFGPLTLRPLDVATVNTAPESVPLPGQNDLANGDVETTETRDAKAEAAASETSTPSLASMAPQQMQSLGAAIDAVHQAAAAISEAKATESAIQANRFEDSAASLSPATEPATDPSATKSAMDAAADQLGDGAESPGSDAMVSDLERHPPSQVARFNSDTGSAHTGSAHTGSAHTGSADTGSADSAGKAAANATEEATSAPTTAAVTASPSSAASQTPLTPVLTPDLATSASNPDGIVTDASDTTSALSAAEEADLALAESEAPGGDSVLRQVRRAMGAIRNVGEGDHEFKIRLVPKELGSISIEIRSSDAGIAIGMVTETSAASDRLNEQRDQLMQELTESGMDASSVDISQEDRPFGSFLGNGAETENASGPSVDSSLDGAHQADQTTASTTALGVNTAAGSGRVDIAL